MNRDRIEGKLKQVKGAIRERWGGFTGDQRIEIAGRRDSLAGKIQERYGISRDDEEAQLTDWQKRMRKLEHLA